MSLVLILMCGSVVVHGTVLQHSVSSGTVVPIVAEGKQLWAKMSFLDSGNAFWNHVDCPPHVDCLKSHGSTEVETGPPHQLEFQDWGTPGRKYPSMLRDVAGGLGVGSAE
jgi:hypothetical protein